ncbi:DAZ-associated protein 2 [Triplophysa rosa]|uniref:DAZ-associated protein 2 n=1 Tax=Triplophysa rosa TaxID=992332 RepID=A0A9W7WC63_TRIRA|nr:DAZ-associated protein 2 [Triplophysa rosa]KAI7793830.1 DAZ-associated protein 2 [Triplophysa rosa]
MNNKGSYPQQAVYPQQSTAPVYPPAMQVQPQVSPYPDAPPPYSEVYQPRYMAPPQAPGHIPQMTSAYPGTQMYMPMAQSVPMGAMASSVPMAYYPMGPMYPHGSTMMVESGYDAGARFGPGTTNSIPPVPPGHMPNAAQLAAMQGANVVMTQRKGNFFMGSGGGYTIW